MAHTILIAEDEKDIRDILAFNFKKEGFQVFEAADGAQALAMAREKKPDLILLDVMMPVMDGLDVCRALQRDKSTASIPVVMLTAKGEEIDRIVGLEIGASDYVVKPFSMREVLLRARSVVRRHERSPDAATMQAGHIMLDGPGHMVTVNGNPIDLTVTEFRLLEDLLRHLGAVRSREQLLDSVWGYSFEGYARTVDTHVRRLRAKLGEAAETIETVRGIGYRARGQA